LSNERKRLLMRILREMLILAIGALMLIYLVNPTAGILELLPDNLPFVGNLDEAGATLILLRVLAYYGINLSGPIRDLEARRNQPPRG
jgi:hypothetical protein